MLRSFASGPENAKDQQHEVVQTQSQVESASGQGQDDASIAANEDEANGVQEDEVVQSEAVLVVEHVGGDNEQAGLQAEGTSGQVGGDAPIGVNDQNLKVAELEPVVNQEHDHLMKEAMELEQASKNRMEDVAHDQQNMAGEEARVDLAAQVRGGKPLKNMWRSVSASKRIQVNITVKVDITIFSALAERLECDGTGECWVTGGIVRLPECPDDFVVLLLFWSKMHTSDHYMAVVSRRSAI